MRWMKTKIEYINVDYVTPGSKPNSTNYQMCNDGKITVKFLYIPLLSSINYVQLDLKLWSTNSFLNIYFIFLFLYVFCLHLCIWTICLISAYRDQESVLGPLEMELWEVMSHHMGAENQIGVSFRSSMFS